MYADGAPGAWTLIIVFTPAGAVTFMFAVRSLWPALREPMDDAARFPTASIAVVTFQVRSFVADG